MYLRCLQLRIPVMGRRFPLFRHRRDLRTVLLLRHRGMGQLRLLRPPVVRARVGQVDQVMVVRVREDPVPCARRLTVRRLLRLRLTVRRRLLLPHRVLRVMV